MRTSAFTTAFLALATVVSTGSADDFSALLADLSFGDAPAPALAVAAEENAEQLQPVPTGLTMPDMVESTPQVEAVADAATEIAAQAEQSIEVKESVEVQSAPQVALKDPIPVTESSDVVDLDAAFALQGEPVYAPRVASAPSQVVGHVFHRCDQQACDVEGIQCRPHVKPILPSSSFYQYFRSNPCYTNVWDGYQRRCGSHHAHIHGECDCFQKSSQRKGCGGWIVGGCNDDACVSCDKGCNRNAGGSCDAGCDR